MNPLIKSLCVVVAGGFSAGAALAGPGDAHPSFAYFPAEPKTETVTIALFRGSSERMMKVEEKRSSTTTRTIETSRESAAPAGSRMPPRY